MSSKILYKNRIENLVILPYCRNTSQARTERIAPETLIKKAPVFQLEPSPCPLGETLGLIIRAHKADDLFARSNALFL